jgi:anti-anti-sigma factor
MSTNTKIIQPSGILNAISGNQLRRDINNYVATGANVLLIDLQQIDFVDSSGLSALVAAMQIVKSSGGQMFLCSVNDQAKNLFKLTETEKIFNYFANQDEFEKVFLSIQRSIQVINYSIDYLSIEGYPEVVSKQFDA